MVLNITVKLLVIILLTVDNTSEHTLYPQMLPVTSKNTPDDKITPVATRPQTKVFC